MVVKKCGAKKSKQFNTTSTEQQGQGIQDNNTIQGNCAKQQGNKTKTQHVHTSIYVQHSTSHQLIKPTAASAAAPAKIPPSSLSHLQLLLMV